MLEHLGNLIEIFDNDEKPTKANPSPAKFRISIDEKKIDIYKQFDTSLIPKWEPQRKIKPLSEVKTMHLDIETDLTIGTMPDKFVDDDDLPLPMWKVHPIVMIGVMNGEGKKIIIHDESEVLMIRKFLYILERESPEILTTFNGFQFDLPYIIGRAGLLGIKTPFTIDSRETCHRAAQRFSGHPTIYEAIRLKNKDGSHCAIIDLYHQLLAWDNVARKLEKYTLKAAPLQMGLRKEARLDLGADGIKDCIVNKKWDILKEYLIYDLEDTKDLADILLPSIYYQKLFIDWNLQSLATGGNGSKWDSILCEVYGYTNKLDPRLPKTQERHKYVGGYTDAVGGLYKNVFKIDVASLYPHIMLYWGIYDKDKDPQMKLLSVLNYLLTERLRLKKLGKAGDILAKQMEGAMKVLINSGYGAFGTVGICFNSYKCAAMVTAIGRAIALKMVEKAVEVGCNVIQVDTDGVCIENTSEYTNDELHEYIQDAMPKGINLDYEWWCESFFVPFSNDKKSKSTGKKKHYIMLNLHEQKKGEWVKTKDIKVKGLSFTGRNRSKLDRDFQANYLFKLHNEGKNIADKEYFELRKKIITGQLEIENIVQRKRLGGHEKNLPLQLGRNAGEIVDYYRGQDKPRFHKISGKQLVGEPWHVEKGEYNKEYYTERLDNMYKELFARKSKVVELMDDEEEIDEKKIQSILKQYVSDESLKSYIEYIKLRDEVSLLRINSETSEHPYFANHPSTQNRRYMDRESQYFIKARNNYQGDYPISDAVFHLIFRKFSTYEKVLNNYDEYPGNLMNDGKAEEVADFIINNCDVPFTGAYLVPHRDKKFTKKVAGWLDIFNNYDLEKISKMQTAKEVFDFFKSINGFGDFLAMQFTTELGWLDSTQYGGNEFVIPGNGAVRGLKKLGVPEKFHSQAIKELSEMNLLSDSPWMPLTYMDIQNTFCEYDKFTRYNGGFDNGGREKQKRKRRANSEPITDFTLTNKLKSEDYYK